MKLIRKSKDLFYLIFPTNLIKDTKEERITKIKDLFLKYNEKYQLLEPGFYDIKIYTHKLIGTFLSVELIDSFDFTKEVDLKIIIKDKIKLYLKLIEPLDFNSKDSKMDLDTISYKEFLTLIEHGTITLN